MVSIHADSISLNMEQNKFQFFGKQMITRKSSVITRKLITEGFFEDIIRSPNNPHGVLLKTGASSITKNSPIKPKTRIKMNAFIKQTGKNGWTVWLKIRKGSLSIR
jgi:hypothetical protein